MKPKNHDTGLSQQDIVYGNQFAQVIEDAMQNIPKKTWAFSITTERFNDVFWKRNKNGTLMYTIRLVNNPGGFGLPRGEYVLIIDILGQDDFSRITHADQLSLAQSLKDATGLHIVLRDFKAGLEKIF